MNVRWVRETRLRGWDRFDVVLIALNAAFFGARVAEGAWGWAAFSGAICVLLIALRWAEAKW